MQYFNFCLLYGALEFFFFLKFACCPNSHHCVFIGERKQKILCSRESDRVVVSDQRCHGVARPAVITEPCNTECELRFVFCITKL